MESPSNSENSPHGQSALSNHNIYNYGFSQESLNDIPHPDDSSYKEQKPITMLLHPDDLELPPLPPEQISYKPVPESKGSEPCNPDVVSFPAQIPLPDDHFQKLTVPALRSDTNTDQYIFIDVKKQSDEEPTNTEMKTFGDSARYSPSKMDSDEENQDFITIKPKVLGKEQAKKRLMAFSLSKQPTCTVKKQNKIASLPKNIKEKPPNPNKSTGVQDQFRATISEIEEEKKRMMQNMPNYLLLEMSDLAKATHPIITSSLKLLEKHKAADAEMKDAGKKEDENFNKSDDSKSQENKESGSKAKQRSKSPNRSFDRTRSRSRERKYHKKNRDSSKSRRRRRSRSKSPVKKSKDKYLKQDKKDSDNYPKKKDLHEDWKGFKASGFTGISDIWGTILQGEECEKERDREYRWSLSPSNDRRCFKPTFNYLKKDQRFIKSFQARSVDSRTSNSVVFTEKKIKYTKTKPMLIWSENPSVATEFYMSRQMLLDNCDSDTIEVLNSILHSEVNSRLDDLDAPKKFKIREWYSDCNQFLRPPVASLYDEFEIDVPKGYEKSEQKTNKMTMQSYLDNDGDKLNSSNTTDSKRDIALINEDKNVNENNESWDTSKNLKERRINIANDKYTSDEEKGGGKLKEVVVGDVKVQMNLDLNSVKVRSRWDSDYECEDSDNEEVQRKQKEDISASMPEIKLCSTDRKGNLSSNTIKSHCQELKPGQQIEKVQTDFEPKNESEVVDVSYSDKAENLASEYEEFLKMVSFEFDSCEPVENKDKPYESGSKLEKRKSSNQKEETEKQMFEMTDWDKDSDHEGKVINKANSRKSESEKEFLLENEKIALKQKKGKKTPVSKKKIAKLKKEKLSKRTGKSKKKKQGSSSSTESSSDSYDSDSDSISDWDDSASPKKKKKKMKKIKKKYRKESSSSSSDSESDSSDSDSDDSKSKKRKAKKKKDKKKKKDGSSKSEDERESVLLKELDIKKQIIMKKIEEIDSISERNVKKKTKESKKREKENLESSESPGKSSRSGKKKKTDGKGEKNKKGKSTSKGEKENKMKKRTLSGDSSEENDSKAKSKKKVKKVEGKKERDIAKSSDSDFDKEDKSNRATGTKRSKSHEKIVKKIKKNKRFKKKSYSSSTSDSDSSPAEENDKPKKKKVRSKENDESTNCSWKDDFMMDDDFRNEKSRTSLSGGKLEWKEGKKKSNEKVKKSLKDNGDWEESSSEESFSDSKSRESWEEEAPCKDKKVTKAEVLKEQSGKNIDFKMSEKGSSERKSAHGPDKDIGLKPFSNFSFGFESEMSRNFLLAGHGYSNSEPIGGSEDFGNMDIEGRPPSSISQGNDQAKPNKSELYSPGHSDSELSENEGVENAEKTKLSGRLIARDEKYDPLNIESESSVENDEHLNTIPLPRISSTSVVNEIKISDTKLLGTSEMTSATAMAVDSSHSISCGLKDPANGSPKFKLKSMNFTTSQVPSSVTNSFIEDADKIAIKKQLMSVKSQPKLQSKAASVFQEDSDESTSDIIEKPKEISPAPVTDAEKTDRTPEENSYKSKPREHDLEKKKSSKTKSDEKKSSKRERSRERSDEKERKKRRSSSRERKSNSKSARDKTSSPVRRRKSKTPEFTHQAQKKESKREIRSDSFEIEPLKSAAEYQDLEETIQPIPVLTGLGAGSSEQPTWTRSHFPGYTSNEITSGSGQLIDPSESFDIYPSEDSTYRQQSTEKGSRDRFEDSVEKTKEKKEIRRSRSRSPSPRKRRRSKSPEKRKKSRSPRRRSKSPKRRGRSPYSPRRKSPKRKSPSRRYRSSRSPDRRRKSRSRSPRKRRGSPVRRSHSLSPRGHRCDSPRRRSSPSRGYSPRGSLSPRRDSHFSNHFSNSFHNRIPVIGGGSENLDRELSPSSAVANPMGFPHQPPGFNDPHMNNPYYSRDYAGEFGTTTYPEEIGVNNLITLKNPDVEKATSPERLSLDQRIELELGVPMNNQGPGDQYQKGQFQEVNFQSSYNCEDGNSGQEPFYPSHNVPINSEYNSSYYNGQPPPQAGYGSFQQYPNSQGSMLQVGNNVEVVPSMQHSHSSQAVPAKSSCQQIMQVGNVLQVVPSQKSSQASPMPFHGQNYGPPGTSPVPPVKTQKATAVVAPSSIVPQQNPEAMINPLIKAIQLEREKRKLEKNKRKEEREARRKARQLRREAKLMSVNEKLKKSVQDEGLMLGQEVEDDELLDGLDLPSPPIPVEIITVSSPSALPPAGKGILITAGFMPKPPSEKKEVKFADGVLPGEGTSSSGEEDIASPPPKPKLPKEKRYKKKKMKVKKKVKVQIIKEIIQDDDEDDDLSPPPPPPGSPPPIYFARFPFAGDAQFPVYQMQTTTTTLTTVQYATPTF